MKTYWKLFLLSALFLFGSVLALQAQDEIEADSTGLPGDNFSLEGAIELFKKSASLEEFEKSLNEEGNNVNNLDLNEDGEVDYIRVIDQMEGDVHAIVLQVPFNENEFQDIAVIEIEKTGDESAILQIVGDEDVYGEQVLAEPFEEEAADNADGRNGPSAAGMAPVRIVVNVWLWPSVRWMYRPGYVVYVSPYRWGVYPRWYRPWRPHPWRTFYVGSRPYYHRCHRVHTHRVVRAHTVYTPRRRTTTVVHTRTTTHVNTYGKPSARRTSTTTTVKNKNGRTATSTTTTKKATGARGATAKKSTTTKTATGPGGRSATRTTTTKKATGPRGNTAGKKSTTTTVKGKNGGSRTKTTTTKGRKRGG